MIAIYKISDCIKYEQNILGSLSVIGKHCDAGNVYINCIGNQNISFLNIDNSYSVNAWKTECDFIKFIENVFENNKNEDVLLLEDCVEIFSNTIEELQRVLQENNMVQLVKPFTNVDRFYPCNGLGKDSFLSVVEKIGKYAFDKNILYCFAYQGCCLVSKSVLGDKNEYEFKDEGVSSYIEDFYFFNNRRGYVAYVSFLSATFFEEFSDCKSLASDKFSRKYTDFDNRYADYFLRNSRRHLVDYIIKNKTASLDGQVKIAFDLTVLPKEFVFNGIYFSIKNIITRMMEVVPDDYRCYAIMASSSYEAYSIGEWSDRLINLPFEEMALFEMDLIVRLAQPCCMADLKNLCFFGRKNIVVIHDIISYDCLQYSSYLELANVFSYVNEFLDGSVFISDFTASVFNSRFDGGCKDSQYVIRHSLSLPDYYREANCHDIPSCLNGEKFVFVVGNNLKHKNVEPCVDAICESIECKVVALGDVCNPDVVLFSSGNIPNSIVDALYAYAEYVIFPSEYEGFGFPLLIALAYGKTVFVKRSTLNMELFNLLGCPRSVVMFSDYSELIALLDGREDAFHKVGDSGYSWTQVAIKYWDIVRRTLDCDNFDIVKKRIEYWGKIDL